MFPICAMQLHRTIGIPVFPNMVTWNAWPDAFFAPAVLVMVDAAEACLILEHKAHFSTAHVEILVSTPFVSMNRIQKILKMVFCNFP